MAESSRVGSGWPFRRAIIAVECLVVAGGIAGTVQLWTGTYAPPVADVEPLGLTSWRLPALWLFIMVVAPSTVAAWLAWRKSPHTPTAVLVASAALAAELVIQIPFVGTDVLQAVFGGVALGLAAAALVGRHRWGGTDAEHPPAVSLS